MYDEQRCQPEKICIQLRKIDAASIFLPCIEREDAKIYERKICIQYSKCGCKIYFSALNARRWVSTEGNPELEAIKNDATSMFSAMNVELRMLTR